MRFMIQASMWCRHTPTEPAHRLDQETRWILRPAARPSPSFSVLSSSRGPLRPSRTTEVGRGRRLLGPVGAHASEGQRRPEIEVFGLERDARQRAGRRRRGRNERRRRLRPPARGDDGCAPSRRRRRRQDASRHLSDRPEERLRDRRPEALPRRRRRPGRRDVAPVRVDDHRRVRVVPGIQAQGDVGALGRPAPPGGDGEGEGTRVAAVRQDVRARTARGGGRVYRGPGRGACGGDHTRGTGSGRGARRGRGAAARPGGPHGRSAPSVPRGTRAPPS